MNQQALKIHTHQQKNPESRELTSRLCDLLEDMDTQVRALRALSGLINGSHDTDIAELGYLLDPIIERLKAIHGEFDGALHGGVLTIIDKGNA